MIPVRHTSIREESKMNTLLRKDNKAQDHYRKDFVEVGTGIWMAMAWVEDSNSCVEIEQEFYGSKEDAEARLRAWGKRKQPSLNDPNEWMFDVESWASSNRYILEVREVMKRQPVIAGYTFEVQFEQDPQRDHTWVYEGEKTLQELMIDADEEGENHWNGIVEEAIDEAVFLDPDNEIGSHARFTLVF